MAYRLSGIATLVCLLTGLWALPAAQGQSIGGDFELSRHTVDAGGGTSAASDFELVGSIAQAEANAQQSAGGEFVLSGGFWARAADNIFSDGFESN